MDARGVLATKRDGGELSAEEIRWVVAGHASGEVPDYVASALLMAIFVHGMGEGELERWTRAMLETGRVLDLSALDRPKVDKHSTGGVGDKVSLALAPAAAACGLAVPMISGRGLGHTGGTLDKLESIPGLSTALSLERIGELLERTGLAFGAQTDELVPADRAFYALRDATGLIASIPLVASSILSKKLAEDLDGLVLDVKFGSGAFFQDPERGAELARTMIALAARFGLRASALLTSMEQPLGNAVGNALEVRESLACLSGEGPEELTELVRALGGEMLRLGGLVAGAAEGEARIGRALADGSALRAFERAIEAQGGDPRVAERPELLPAAPDVAVFSAPHAGYVHFCDLRAVGLAALALGAGRQRLGDPIDPAVGIVWRAKAGARVGKSEPLAEIHHRSGRGLSEALAQLARAVALLEAPPAPSPLVLARLGA